MSAYAAHCPSEGPVWLVEHRCRSLRPLAGHSGPLEGHMHSLYIGAAMYAFTITRSPNPPAAVLTSRSTILQATQVRPLCQSGVPRAACDCCDAQCTHVDSPAFWPPPATLLLPTETAAVGCWLLPLTPAAVQAFGTAEMKTAMRSTALALALLGALLVGVESHGSLTIPRSRNVLSPIEGQTWWKDHGNGHGGTLTAPGPKPAWGPGRTDRASLALERHSWTATVFGRSVQQHRSCTASSPFTSSHQQRCWRCLVLVLAWTGKCRCHNVARWLGQPMGHDVTALSVVLTTACCRCACAR